MCAYLHRFDVNTMVSPCSIVFPWICRGFGEKMVWQGLLSSPSPSTQCSSILLFYCSAIASTVLCELVFVLLDSKLRTSLEDIRHVLLCCACANCAMHIPGKISGIMCCSGKIFGICFERQPSLSSCYQCTVCGTTFTHVH